MSCKIEYEKRVVKFLKKLAKSAPKEFFKIDTFLNEILPNYKFKNLKGAMTKIILASGFKPD
ncbi:hypothetical protein [Campylobacter upsaliensis]|uniref:hypothetical protein n=1 Tax=Campylobacter upsaliensis TaxID=28080 RepID=UPI00214A0F46|nr:hypothetical protein [Campylobacter upsaliensis]MCR2112412.1 hypothetical protein [Campylobacter upsaliensis]